MLKKVKLLIALSLITTISTINVNALDTTSSSSDEIVKDI